MKKEGVIISKKGIEYNLDSRKRARNLAVNWLKEERDSYVKKIDEKIKRIENGYIDKEVIEIYEANIKDKGGSSEKKNRSYEY